MVFSISATSVLAHANLQAFARVEINARQQT